MVPDDLGIDVRLAGERGMHDQCGPVHLRHRNAGQGHAASLSVLLDGAKACVPFWLEQGPFALVEHRNHSITSPTVEPFHSREVESEVYCADRGWPG